MKTISAHSCRLWVGVLAMAALFAIDAPAAGPFVSQWSPGELAQVEPFESTGKWAGTHYFYWYDYPNRHFFDNAAHTDDGLQDHFPDAEFVSYNSIEWHEKQLADCEEAGIDFILPVYWGVVDNYFRPGVSFSVLGLGPLQTAVERRERAGLSSPKIGMFYDTSTLLPGIRGEQRSERYDLRTDEGKDLFYRTIRDFFYQIHPKHWAAIGGHPLVVLYGSGFAKDHDESTAVYVYEQFRRDFNGVRPYIIYDSSWNFRRDAATQWGAALNGPNIFGSVAQIGPGYCDAAVPGRKTPIRDRENGNFYRWSWNKVLNNDINIVLLETWNEMHEGTDICESREYGRQYIQITREYVDKWKRVEKATDSIVLQNPDLLPPPPSTEGGEYRDAASVRITLGQGGRSEGISLVSGNEDGVVENAEIGGSPCTRTIVAGHTYMYFSIVDPFYYDNRQPMVLEYTIWDEGHDWQCLQYDSFDKSATLDGAYKDAEHFTCRNSGQWKTCRVELEDARFVNRQNRGADFRFCVVGGSLAVKDVVIKKLSAAP
ncbi:MAG: DUF5010 domain-containing protein [Candidatus Omnitrophica bacterium]|nr:DUF5010 domain-containing protein [Candidatus Omnitrophota bacterium]